MVVGLKNVEATIRALLKRPALSKTIGLSKNSILINSYVLTLFHGLHGLDSLTVRPQSE